MRRLVVLHPQAAADAVVLTLGGLLALGSWLLGRWAKTVDDALADLGDEDQWTTT